MAGVLDINYMRMLRTTLRHLSSWPSKAVGEEEPRFEKLSRYYIFNLDLACLLPGLLYVRNNAGKISFFELGHTYITVMMNLVAISRLTLVFTKRYRALVGDFVKRIHLFHSKDKSQYAMQTHLLVHKLCFFFTVQFNILVLTGILLFNLMPLYFNYVSGAFYSENLGNVTLGHAVYYALPFDYTTSYRGYAVVFTFNWYISYICSSCFCTFDLLLAIIVFHVWGHLRILIHSIENFDKSLGVDSEGNENRICYSVETNKIVTAKLRDIIVYHSMLIEYILNMSKTFGYTLFVYYSFQQACGCLLLLECSQLTAISLLRYLPLTLFIFQQLIQLSIIFELIGAMSDKLMIAMYCLPWELMNTENRKMVHIMLKQAQLPLNLKALDMIGVGVQTMITILKTSFSYFIMLRSIAT